MQKETKQEQKTSLSRRRFLSYFTGIGMTSSLLPGILWMKCQSSKKLRITKAMLKDAEKLAGIEFTDEERDLMLDGINNHLDKFERMRKIPLENDIQPPLYFSPILPGMTFPAKKEKIKISPVQLPKNFSDSSSLVFLPVTQLAKLIQQKKITSTELTKIYLSRLRQYGEKLKCVVTITEDLAMKQAEKADREISGGHYRGYLHGIPWGVKDIFAMNGYKTTWGAEPYKDQEIDKNAAVVERLENAGAILLAKLTSGALAMGDIWFGGKTLNPWDIEEGSSGSSAGPGAATSAGLVGFSIGTETNGSIVGPSVRCGVTGLRPTFGRVSRYGAMSLSWSMDKIGPMCRTVEDCAIVFDAIYGSDKKDLSVVDIPFNWDYKRNIKKMKIGFLEDEFKIDEKNSEQAVNDNATIEHLRSLEFEIIPVKKPDFPILSLDFILKVEAAATFDELTRSNRDDLLKYQGNGGWPNIFRKTRMIPAVEYVRANRIRTLMMQSINELMSQVDVYIAPARDWANSTLTNLTGHPAVALPNGFTKKGTPTGITFIGKLYQEAELLALAKIYQDTTDFHLKHPVL